MDMIWFAAIGVLLGLFLGEALAARRWSRERRELVRQYVRLDVESRRRIADLRAEIERHRRLEAELQSGLAELRELATIRPQAD